jgi:hypothetical protein
MDKPSNLGQKALSAFSQMTFLAVVALGAATTLTLLEAPSRSITMSGDAPSSSRSPASVSSSTLVENHPVMTTLKLSCLSPARLKTTAEHARFLTEGCLSTSDLKISNETRKTTATVFRQGGALSTDYLGLAKGENVILVEQSVEGRSTQVKHVVIRE